MRKLLNFVWLLAIALSATTVFTSCSKNEDDPNRGEEREKGTVEVNPAKVFINGMPKAIDGYILTCDSKGRLSSLYNKEEKETVTFEYKTNVLGSTDEPNVVMTMREENEKTVYNLFLNKDGFVKLSTKRTRPIRRLHGTLNTILTDNLLKPYNLKMDLKLCIPLYTKMETL